MLMLDLDHLARDACCLRRLCDGAKNVFGMLLTPATAFEGKTARGNLGWWWLRVRGRHGP